MKQGKGAQLKYKVFARVSQETYDDLLTVLGKSRCRTMSELIRYILTHEEIAIAKYNPTLDKVMGELSGIRKELQAIGININQVTRQFHTEDKPEGRLFQALEIGKLYQQTDQKTTELMEIISRMSELWLPK